MRVGRDQRLAKNELVRVVKALRDGSRPPSAIAALMVELRPRLHPSDYARVALELGRPTWIEPLRRGSLAEILSLSEYIEARPPPAPMATEAGGTETGVATPSGSAVAGRDARPRMVAVSFVNLTVDEVLSIHFALVEDFASTEDPIVPSGVKHPHLLESAVSRQYTGFGGEQKYKRFAEMGASLFYGLAMNHPFHNGNKRTALVSFLVLADKNRMDVVATQDGLYEFVLSVVEHRFRPAQISGTQATDREIDAIAAWLQPRLRRQQARTKMLKGRELKALLRQFECEIANTSGSALEVVRGDARSVVDYDGDSREVGRLIVKKLRRDLHLSENDGIDDEVFFGYVPPLDDFISKYKNLLRSLAHV